MRVLALLLILVSCGAEAATYYLDTSCTYNGNGTGNSGACAAFGGAAGAFNTGASITYSSGDVIYIKAGTTVTNLPTPISASVTIDDYGTGARPIISQGGTFIVSVSGANVTVNDIAFTGNATSSGVNLSGAAATLNRVEIYGVTAAGARALMFNSGSGGSSINDSIIHDIADDGIGVAAAASGTITVANHTCYRVDTANLTGDCLQAYTGTSTDVVVVGGSWTKETANKQAIIYDGSGSLTVRGQPQIDVRGGAQGIQVAGSGSFTLTSAFIRGGAASAKLVQLSNTGTSTLSGLIATGGVDGVYVSHASGSAFVYHSTITGQSNSSVYHTTGGSLTVKDSYLSAPTSLLDASASATTVADYNRYGVAAFQWNGTPYASLAAWQAASSQDANSTVGVMDFEGGESPTTANGFKPSAGSALRRAGIDLNLGNMQDAGNRAFLHPPSIGAWEATSGDEAAARTVATARTVSGTRTSR